MSDNGHSAGGWGGRVKATAVGAVGCVCAVGTSIILLGVRASIKASALVGCRVKEQICYESMQHKDKMFLNFYKKINKTKIWGWKPKNHNRDVIQLDKLDSSFTIQLESSIVHW